MWRNYWILERQQKANLLTRVQQDHCEPMQSVFGLFTREQKLAFGRYFLQALHDAVPTYSCLTEPYLLPIRRLHGPEPQWSVANQHMFKPSTLLITTAALQIKLHAQVGGT